MAVDSPNVVVLLPDQWRAASCGYAGNDDVETPNVNALAEEGIAFGSAYTTKPMCTPARASLLTGTYPHTNRVIHNELTLPTDQPSIGTLLGGAGYETAYVGKWHLDGDADVHVPPGDRRHGFEHWHGFNTSDHDYERGHPVVTDDGEIVWEGEYQPTVQTDLAIDLLRDLANRPEPFFLFVSYGPPHPPKGGWPEADAPDEYSERYDPGELTLRPNVPDDDIQIRPHLPSVDADRVRADHAEYYGYITSIDDEIRRIRDTFDELGLNEETLLVFTSDHGEMLGSQGRYNKGAPFEEAIRVPLVFRHEGRLDPEAFDQQPVNLIDLVPTILSYCDVEIPDSVQGQDLTGVLQEGETESLDPVYVEGWRVEDDIPGEPDWGPFGQPWRLLRTAEYMITVDRTLETCYLFDMVEDPYQTNNLAGEPEAADLETRLRKRLFRACERYDDRQFVVRREYIENRHQFHDR